MEEMEGKAYSVHTIYEGFPICVDSEEIAKAAKAHPILSKVHRYVMEGWPEKCDQDYLMSYFFRKDQLTCEMGCVMWGHRDVIPPKFGEQILDELYWEHPGVCAMKGWARAYAWWPKMDEEIETKVKCCSVCQSVRPMPARVPWHPWKWPTRPFQRIHVDFCEDSNKYYLILVDSTPNGLI
jgi:hypothetical protein